MSAITYLLATRDPDLLRAWWVLVPAEARVVTLNEVKAGARLARELPTIVVIDEAALGDLPQSCREFLLVLVGERTGKAYEQLTLAGADVRVVLSHDESRTRLGEFFPLLETIATHDASVKLPQTRQQTVVAEAPRATEPSAVSEEAWWEWLSEVGESLDDREQLLAAFRRGARRWLHTEQVLFFLPADDGWRADRGNVFCANSDVLARHLTRHPVVIDARTAIADVDPVVELSIRRRLGEWGLHLLVPMHDNGHLAGWIGFGLREDGQAYATDDIARARKLARVLRRLLERHLPAQALQPTETAATTTMPDAQRAERIALLHDLALTLNHELGNSLVSLTALRHKPGAETNSPVLLAAIRRDIGALEAINRQLAALPTFLESTAERIDLRGLVHAVARNCGIAVETDSDEVTLDVVPKLIEFGLEAIVESVAENRPGLGKNGLMLALSRGGSGAEKHAVIALRGEGLALEGVWPSPEPGATPTHGRIGVFIAKEVVRLHGGALTVKEGRHGAEIVITIRRW